MPAGSHVREYPVRNNVNLKERSEISGHHMRTLLPCAGKEKDVQEPECSLCCLMATD